MAIKFYFLAIFLNRKCQQTLDNAAQGLLIESCIWREMSDFSEDCVLMVLADNFYDESDYIRDYDEFLKIVKDKE